MATYQFRTTSGPNADLPFSLSCAINCVGTSQMSTWNLRSDPLTTPSLDTVQVWDDNDLDGVADAEEPTGSSTVRWNRAVHVVALGDSYSSGEGLDPYDPGTDLDHGFIWDLKFNQCHRSPHAYSRSLQPIGYQSPIADYLGGPTDTTYDMLACAGATTTNVIHDDPTQARDGKVQYSSEDYTQSDNPKLDDDTTLVTISIGGNDVGFSEWTFALFGRAMRRRRACRVGGR